MKIQENLKECVVRRAAEIAAEQITTTGKVDITLAVQQATEEVKLALNCYMTIMKTMHVVIEGMPVPEGKTPEQWVAKGDQ